MGQAARGKPRVVFLHIGKTAGSTLRGILSRHYKPEEIFRIDSRRVLESVAEFKSLPPERRAQIMLVKGHLPFGLHEYLPPPTTYITMLRDPVARIVSHYHFARRTPRHYLHRVIHERNLDIEHYVSSGLSWELDNGQVRHLTNHGDHVEFGGCTSDLLDKAKSTLLEHFVVTGLSERFDESLLLLRRRLGWPGLPVYQSRNVAPNRSRVQDLSDSALRTIRKYNQLDLELHEWAATRFQNEWKAENLDRELRVFRMMNSAYESYGRLKAVSRRLVSGISSVVTAR